MLNAGAQSFSLSRKAGNETIKEDFPGLDFKKSIVVAIVYGVGGMLLGGYFQQHVPSWLAWLQYGTYMLYSYDAALSIEFSSSPTFR